MANPPKGSNSFSNISDSNIITGHVGGSVSNTRHQGLDPELMRVLAFLRQVQDALPQLGLAEFQRDKVLVQISTIDAEVKQPKPRRPLIERALGVLSGILMGVVGNTAFAGLEELINTAESLIQG